MGGRGRSGRLVKGVDEPSLDVVGEFHLTRPHRTEQPA